MNYLIILNYYEVFINHISINKNSFCFTESAPQEAQYIYNTLEVLGKDKSISL